MTELIRFLMVRSCVMTRTMHAWRKDNAYVRSGQHDRAIYWLWRTQAILDAGPPCRSRLKDVDAGYMLAALFFFVLIWHRGLFGPAVADSMCREPTARPVASGR